MVLTPYYHKAIITMPWKTKNGEWRSNIKDWKPDWSNFSWPPRWFFWLCFLYLIQYLYISQKGLPKTEIWWRYSLAYYVFCLNPQITLVKYIKAQYKLQSLWEHCILNHYDTILSYPWIPSNWIIKHLIHFLWEALPYWPFLFIDVTIISLTRLKASWGQQPQSSLFFFKLLVPIPVNI
jgi:hypothetical protein